MLLQQKIWLFASGVAAMSAGGGMLLWSQRKRGRAMKLVAGGLLLAGAVSFGLLEGCSHAQISCFEWVQWWRNP